MTQTSTHLSSNLPNNVEFNNSFSIRNYYSAWLKFREYSNENSILINFIKETLTLFPTNNKYSLIDVGSGSAELVSKLIQKLSSKQRPEFLHLLEPSPVLYEKAKKNIYSVFSPQGLSTKCRTQQSALRDFIFTNEFNTVGIVLIVHVSYYFNSEDIEVVKNLRNQGFGVLVIENSSDCWVSKVMRAIGNNQHPQFDLVRLEKLLDSLDLNKKDIIVKTIKADLKPLSINDSIKLLDFFAYQGNDRFCDLAISIKNFQKILSQITLNKPYFAYNTVYVPPFTLKK